MSENPAVAPGLVTAALAAAPMLERFYCLGGGSPSDLRTDLSAALAVVQDIVLARERHEVAIVPPAVIDLVDRRRQDAPFAGQDRRQH